MQIVSTSQYDYKFLYRPDLIILLVAKYVCHVTSIGDKYLHFSYLDNYGNTVYYKGSVGRQHFVILF